MTTPEYAKFGRAIDNCKTQAEATRLRTAILKKADDQDRQDLLGSLATASSGLPKGTATKALKKKVKSKK